MGRIDDHCLSYDELVYETDAAWLIWFYSEDPETKIWIPKSKCEIDEVGNKIQMPDWLVEEHDLYDYVV